jgi:hypothetical protein
VRTIALLASVLFGLPYAPWQTPRDARPDAVAGSAVVEGRVQNEHGEPLDHATVVAVGVSVRFARAVRTDSTGRYSLEKLSPGTYVVVASSPGYMTTAFGGGALYGLGPFDGRSVTLVLSDGERFVAPIVLARVSALSGTVVDEHGLPTVAIVSVFFRRPAGGRGSALSVVARTQADRLGRYRVEGLPPNAYLVRAERPSTISDLRQMDPEILAAAIQSIARTAVPLPVRDLAREAEFGYRATYYPGVTSSRIARPVRVEPGSEHTGIDLQLELTRTVTFEATVVYAAGRSADSATMKLTGEDEAVEHQGTMHGDGRFLFTGVPPGRYMLAARASVAPLPERPRALLWGSQEISVETGARVAPSLTLHPGADISGRVVFSGSSPIPEVARAPAPLVQLITVASEFTRFAPATPALRMTAPDAEQGESIAVSFESVAPGRYRIASTSSGDWSLRSAMLNGVDVSAVPFEVRAGDDLKELVLTFTDRPASLTGTIRNESGEPVYAHTLVVFPVDRRARFAGPGGRIKAVRPDSRGRYDVRPLPAGEYLVALARDVAIDALHEEMLDALEAGAVRVTLVEGRDTVQDLLARTGAAAEPLTWPGV